MKKNLDEIILFCFNELPVERQRKLECQLLYDDILCETISSVFRVKRELSSKEKVLEYFSIIEFKTQDKLLKPKAV